MPTDNAKKESGESGTHPVAADDLIEVRFAYEPGEDVKGRIRGDAFGRRKLVSIESYASSLKWLRRPPQNRERWVCRVIRDTDPDNALKGRLYVQLVQPRHLIFPVRSGAVLLVPEATLIKLESTPQMLRLIYEATTDLEFSTEQVNQVLQLDFHHPVGFDPRVSAPKIAYDEPTSFAMRRGYGLSRVLRGSNEGRTPVSRITLWVSPENNTYGQVRLEDAIYGDVAPREPRSTYAHLPHMPDMKKKFDASVAYWTTHAFLYDSTTMGPIVTSTWQEVIERLPRFPGSRERAA
ncbi:hypothetical protein KBC59_04150 [Patescibacteria group bacterium]|jgi:hypothetical protein|nr:hypothetical protein [Patescibacteria group bacterium]